MSMGLLKHAAPTELPPLVGHESTNIALLTELYFPDTQRVDHAQPISENLRELMCETAKDCVNTSTERQGVYSFASRSGRLCR
jgi:purine nucleoside phosphorylase